jgi:hypothetical protein
VTSQFFNHAEAEDWSFTSVVQDVEADQSRIEIAILMRSFEERDGRSQRKIYRATPLGRRALGAAKGKIRGLFQELTMDK